MTRTEEDESWLEREIARSEFRDARLRKRFGLLLERLWKGMGQTIPLACQDWANTKAAYRFMGNDRVNEQDILSGHFQATAQRFSVTDGPILVLQDTTSFSYERERPELIGYASNTLTAAKIVVARAAIVIDNLQSGGRHLSRKPGDSRICAYTVRNTVISTGLEWGADRRHRRFLLRFA